MVKRACVLLLLIGMSFVAKSEMTPSAEDRARLINGWMKQKLALTNDQIPKVEALNLKYEKVINELIAEGEAFNCMQAVRNSLAEKEKKLQALLTAQQFEEYQECKCELRELLRKDAT